jgi:hypothetical protein
MKEIENLAETVRTQFNLEFDTNSMKFIEGFIERQKNKFDQEQQKGLINSIGAFVGQCVIKNYGGQWEMDKELNSLCVSFDSKNKVYPFAKTSKQFENGLEDSVYSFYEMIPFLFKLNHPINNGDTKIEINIEKTERNKKWWKFW